MRKTNIKRIRRTKRYLRELPKHLRNISFEDSIQRVQKYHFKKSSIYDDCRVQTNGRIEMISPHLLDLPSSDRDGSLAYCLHCDQQGRLSCQCADDEDIVNHRLSNLKEKLLRQDKTMHFGTIAGGLLQPPRSSIYGGLTSFKHDLRYDFESAATAIEQSAFDQAKDLTFVVKVATSKYSEKSTTENLIKILLAYSPFWIRDLKAWPGGTFHQLIAHLFIAHSVPVVLIELLSASMIDQAMVGITSWALDWLIVIGQGGNLRKAPSGLDWHITGKYQAALLRVSKFEYAKSLSLSELFDYAEVYRLGGDQRAHRLLSLATASNGLPTIRRCPQLRYGVFWTNAIKWVIDHEYRIDSSRQCTSIFRWAADQLERHTRMSGRPLTKFWQGRTLRSVLTRVRAERHLLPVDAYGQGAWSLDSWQKQGWDWELKRGRHHWRIIELASGSALYEEGTAMQHCVGSYTGQCHRKQSAIFSLTDHRYRVATVEVDLGTQAIVTALGRSNQKLVGDPCAFLDVWKNRYLRNP